MNNPSEPQKKHLSRRDALKLGLAVGAVAALAAGRPQPAGASDGPHPMDDMPVQPDDMPAMAHGDLSGTVGDVDLTRFDPGEFLYAFDWGSQSTGADGITVREWNVSVVEKEIEIAPGVFFPAWTYNGQVPGPTFRCREGDLLRFNFLNSSSHPHTIHFHGFHPPAMDGVEPIVQPGESFTYEFKARPFGVHPYHCHVMSLKKHIHKGLYGTLIIDPPQGRPKAHEMIMVMNALDTTFDSANEI